MEQTLYRIFHPRKAQIFVIGTAKSGTHTLAGIWGDQLRSAHEPEADFSLSTFFNWKSGAFSDEKLLQIIREQDKRLWLEVNSSQINFVFLDMLLKIFPASRFILTIRNPYSWLESFFNHQLYRDCSGQWMKFREYRFRPDLFTHPQEEAILKINNLYPLDGYLTYWHNHNKKVIEMVPKDRLLIVRTDQLTDNLDNLARFAGLKNGSKLIANCHEFPSEKKFNILEQLNTDYLDFKIMQHCGELMKIYFPEIKSYHDVF